MAQSRIGRLILLRHGRTSWNASQRFQGQANPPLDAIGLAQATRAAAELCGLHPETIISSDLQRASQTAALLASACGLTVRFHPGLREQALGSWEGLTRAAAATAFPDEYAAWTAGQDVRRGGGERETEAGQRALAALIPILQHGDAGGTLVVVSHGLVLRGLLRSLAATAVFGHPIPVVHLANGQWISLRSSCSRGQDLLGEFGTDIALSYPPQGSLGTFGTRSTTPRCHGILDTHDLESRSPQDQPMD